MNETEQQAAAAAEAEPEASSVQIIRPRIPVKVVLRNPGGNPKQLQLVRSRHKRKMVRAGRRGGKTVSSGIMAVEAFLKGRRVLYAAPTEDQVAKFWSEVKRALSPMLEYKAYYKNETLHVIELPGTQQRIRAKTAWNYETLRGDSCDLLILDEFQLMAEEAWERAGAPMLMDNNGDAVFIYTPPSLGMRTKSQATDKQYAAKMFKKYKNDPEWLCISWTSYDNPHISEEGIKQVSKDLTVLGRRQEILAEDLEEVPGALWSRALIERTRVQQVDFSLEKMRRVVVGIDPSGSTTTEVGIVAAAEDENGHLYFFHDASMKAPRPKAWASKAVSVYAKFSADRIVGERNFGGDMVEETIRTIDENVSYKDVNATRGKMVRAEPVCAKFEKGEAHIVGEWPELEEELVSYVPGERSPNRYDAAVWCGIELMGSGTLGLLELYESGRAEQIVARLEAQMDNTARKPPKAPAAADQGPKCEQCGWTVLQPVSGTLRCVNCGHQQWPNGRAPELPFAKRPRAIHLPQR